MTKLVTFLGRKTVSATEKPATAAPQPPHRDAGRREKPTSSSTTNLFFPIATQLGQENETVRNLLIDAEHKIGELEIIKHSIGKLVDPVSKTLRAYEEAKSEKLSLQDVLNTTRIAHNKLRDDLDATPRRRPGPSKPKRPPARHRGRRRSRASPLTKRPRPSSSPSSPRAAPRSPSCSATCSSRARTCSRRRDENRRLVERVAAADKRMVQLEGEAQAAQQKAMQSTQERAAVQASLDKAHASSRRPRAASPKATRRSPRRKRGSRRWRPVSPRRRPSGSGCRPRSTRPTTSISTR